MSKIKVLVVDDSAFMRKALSNLLTTRDIEVVETARDGKDALKKVENLAPDVVTMDIAMPGMDGLEVLKRIMLEHPTPVLMLSAMGKREADLVVRSLELGALDFISKPSGPISLDIEGIRNELISKVKMAIKATTQPIKGRYKSPKVKGRGEVVAIASSAGGPAALTEILPKLPDDLNAVVLVAQHMPPLFTNSLAERLASKSRIEVREARDEDSLEKGTALIGAGGQHLTINSDGRIKLVDRANLHDASPSADLLMRSIANMYGKKALGVVLTGMGHDGAAGTIAIKERGGSAIAQDEATSMIFSMPKSAIETGCIDEVVPLPYIAKAIVRYCNGDG